MMIATDEYELLTTAVGLIDRSERAKFTVGGGEAAGFLQGQVSNDVEALAPGTGCYAAILNHKGKFRADLRLLRTDEGFWLDADSISHAVVQHMLRTYSLGREVHWEDATQSHALLSLIGPGAREWIEGEEHVSRAGDEGLWVVTDLGADLILPAGSAEAVRERLGVDEVSEAAAECLRIESGRPRLGWDMDGDTIPQEAGVNERAVSFTKGCYVGQETVARLHYKGRPNRHLRGLRLEAPAERGAEILLGERVVGRLGSSCVSPTLGPIALAIVRREVEPGHEVLVEGAPAQVVELPFTS